MFYSEARRLSSKLLKQGYLVERLKSSFRKFYGRYGDLIEQYEVNLSRMLNDILTLDQQWLPNRSDFPPSSWPYTELDLHRIMSGFHGGFATGVASQQETLTLPDTGFRPPFWDLLMLQLLRPNSSNLPCLYSTFHLENYLGPKYRLPSRIDFTKCRDIVEDALQTYCKRWSKKEGVEVHALIDWKNNFYASLTSE